MEKEIEKVDHESTHERSLEIYSKLSVDCTLACNGGKLDAHKIVLATCSPYLKRILETHPVEYPVLILPELKFEDMKVLVHYMYTGVLLCKKISSQLMLTSHVLGINSLKDYFIKKNSTQEPVPICAPPLAITPPTTPTPAPTSALTHTPKTTTKTTLTPTKTSTSSLESPLLLSSSSKSTNLDSEYESPKLRRYIKPKSSSQYVHNYTRSHQLVTINKESVKVNRSNYLHKFTITKSTKINSQHLTSSCVKLSNLRGRDVNKSSKQNLSHEETLSNKKWKTHKNWKGHSESTSKIRVQSEIMKYDEADVKEKRSRCDKTNGVSPSGSVSPDNVFEVIKSNSKKLQLKCVQCSVPRFFNIRTYERHVIEKHDVREFECQHCGRVYNNLRHALTEHVPSHHGQSQF